MAQTYTVYLVAKPSDVLEVTAFEGVMDGAVENAVRDSVTVVFSKPIDPTTFTTNSLTLMKQGVYLNDLSALTITPVDDSGTRFAIGNLSELCSGYGRYELTVQCAGISDTVGRLGAVGKSVAWTFATADVPTISGVDGVPANRVQSLDAVAVTLSAPVDPATFTADALRLNGETVGSGVTITPLDESGTRFGVSGLALAQIQDGNYELTIDASVLISAFDTTTVGVGSRTVRWTRDTVAPILQSITHTDGFNGNEFILTFSEDVVLESLTLDKVTVKRNGVAVASLSATSPLWRAGDNAPYQYVLSGIDPALIEDGEYELTFSADGVTDEAGNVASGSKSVAWTVDNTPPAEIADLAISPDGGYSDTDGVTYTGALTVTGTLPESGLTVAIIAKYVGGSETVLATMPTAGGDSLPAGAFSQNIVMPGTGNATLVVRLTDVAGNSSDTELSVYVDGIALTGTLTCANEDEGVVTSSVTLTVSDKVTDGDVALEKFSLTRDGDAVALEGVTFTKVNDTTYALTGLDSLCAEDGVYMLRFDGSAVRKYTSGLLMSGSPLMMTWRYENPDREPPTVAAVLFDGETPHEAYTNVFSTVAVTFSEAVNVPKLIEKGLIGKAARIDLLDAANAVTGSVAAVAGQSPYQWDAESNTLSWQIDPLSVPAGRTRLMIDAGLIEDLAGNRLAAEGYAATNGMRTYTLSETVLAQVAAQAMPTWYNGELYVGEKTADNKGKIRHYAANGTWTYLQANSVDIEIPAQGCQGASIAFADMDGDGVAETYVGTTGGDVLKYPGGAVIASLGANRAMPYAYDMDGDGREELIAGGMDGRIRLISYDVDSGTYSVALISDVNDAPLTVPNGRAASVVADINHDGIADIVSGDTAGNVWAYLGDGAAWCGQPVTVFTNNVSLADRSRLGYGDVDGDGIEDLIVGRSDGSVTVMLGAETPSPIVPFAVKAVVSASVGAHGAIAPVGDATYDGGDTPEYVITPDVGYHVADVLVDGVSIGATNNYVFTPLTTSHTISADFAVTPYAITYTGLKGATSGNPATYTVEDEITFAAPGSVYGWVFTGWTPASIALGSTGAVEVMANWERQKFDVTVNGETRQCEYEEEVTFTAPEPAETNGMQVVALGTTFTDPVVTNEVSVKITGDITFDWDILATNWWFEVLETQNGTIFAPEEGWIADGTNFVLAVEPAEHYHFVSWTGDTNGCEVVEGGLSVTMDQARTIGAAFAIDTFTVTFGAGEHGSLSGELSQTIDYGSAAVEPTVTPDAGYSFTGWNCGFSEVTGDLTVTAQYATIPYAIAYTGLMGASNDDNPVTYTVEDEVTFAAPGGVYGWVFKGWTPDGIVLGSTGDVEATANWERQKFNVTVNGETRQYSYEDEETFSPSETPVFEDEGMQIFEIGTTWNDIGVTNEVVVKVMGDISFDWDILATNWWFEVSDTQNGAVVAPESGWMADGTNFVITATPAEHYHFAGWTGDTEGCVETNGLLIVAMDRPRTIGAEFAIDTFMVAFEAGAHGALSGATAQTIDYGATAVVPGVTPDAGYEFAGWSGDVAAPVVGDVTFTAQYAAIPYAIAYTGLKGATNPNPVTYTVEDEVTFAAPGDVYGWVFQNWMPASIAFGSTGEVEVAAEWERAKFDVTVNGETRQYSYEDEVTFSAPEPWEADGMQIVALGTTFTAPVVTNEFTVTVTNGIEFAWDITATNWWFATEETSNGSIIAPEAGWIADGDELTLTAMPAAHYHFVRWTGDTEGCETTANPLSLTMDRPRTISAEFAIDPITIGEAVNATNILWNTSGDALWTGEWAADASDGIHAARSGAIGSGQKSVLSIMLEGVGTLSFDWRTSCREKTDSVYLEVDGAFKRMLSGDTAWTNVVVNLGLGEHTVRWVYARGRGESAYDDAAWIDNVTWTPTPEPTLAEALGDFEWETGGDAESGWRAEYSEYAYNGNAHAIAAGLGDNVSAIIGTSVSGAGRLKFAWGVSCEEYFDKFLFRVDGEVMAYVTGHTEYWEEVTVDLDDGDHVLEWEYWKDELDDPALIGANCAMLDYVRWTPAVEVPPETNDANLTAFFEWLKEHNQLGEYSSIDDAAEIMVTRRKAAGRSYTLYAEYVTGTDPENPDNDEFTANIKIVDGKPEVTFSPDTPELRATRTYTILGNKTLDDNGWEPVKEGEESNYNFFKVEVDLKK